jgi:hypothetical protein
MKRITHVVFWKYRKCARCGQEEKPDSITIELVKPVDFDETSDRVEVAYLTDNR